MQPISIEYIVPSTCKLTGLKQAIIEKLKLTEMSSECIDIFYLDSFDWRLFAKNAVLEASYSDNIIHLGWRRLNSSRHLYQLDTCGKIDFAWNLPESRLKSELSKVLKIRALMTQLRLRVQRYHLSMLDSNRKTVLRITLHEYRTMNPETGSSKILQKRLEILPVRGYDKPLRKARELAECELGSTIAYADILLVGLDALGRKPAEYSKKYDIALDTELEAATATRILLLRLLEVMRLNEQGIREDVDSEFLHDYRIALRKSRCILKQIKLVFPQRRVNTVGKLMYWLGSITSTARDMDVYLLKFDSYREMLPVHLQDQLEPLRKLLHQKKRDAYTVLNRVLKSKRYLKSILQYREFLQELTPQKTRLANAHRPVKEISDLRIWKIYKRVTKQGVAINDESPPEDLHELRKSCKKLRYLIELFQSLYDPESIKKLLNTLKKLQDNLGEYNDLHVQVVKLGLFYEELKQQHELTDNSDQAMSLLVQHLNEMQAQERGNFVNTFKKFNTDIVKHQFKNLFNHVQGDSTASQ